MSETKEKKISATKKLMILFVAILLIFGAINAAWYFGYKRTYNELANKMDITIDEIDGKTKRYTKTIDNYAFALKMPTYLGEGGFLTVAESEGAVSYLDDKGEVIGSSGLYISLYIWPQRFGGYKIGIDFYDESKEIWEQVIINGSLQLVSAEKFDDDYVDYLNSLILDNKDEIEDLINAAISLWDVQLF